MKLSKIISTTGKLVLCGFAFIIGMLLGGTFAELLGLQPPQMPTGADVSTIMIYYLITSPIMALALALLARGLSGKFLTRTLILSLMTFVIYTLNTVLDAMLYMSWATISTSMYTIVSFLIPSFFVSGTVAFFFSFNKCKHSFFDSLKALVKQRTKQEWVWRIVLAAISFMPIYIFFGKLVLPLTGDYYQQEMYGLQLPGWNQILPVLFIRSVLFFLVCFPVMVMWQRSRLSLFFNLGFALFILIGFLYLITAYWMPLSIRIPHALEILGSSYIHSAVLVGLLMKHQ